LILQAANKSQIKDDMTRARKDLIDSTCTSFILFFILAILFMTTQVAVLCGVEAQPTPRPIPEIAARTANQRSQESLSIRQALCEDMTNGPNSAVTENLISLLSSYLMDPDSDVKAKDLMVVIAQRFFTNERFQSSDDMRLMEDLFVNVRGGINGMIQKHALSEAEAVSIICGSSNFVKLMESHRIDNYVPIKVVRPDMMDLGPEGGHSGMDPSLIKDPDIREAYIKKLAAREKNRFENARQRFINQSLSRSQDSLRTTIRLLYPAGDATNEERFTVLCGMVGIKPKR
jgi:hypothetical protein